MKRNLKSGKRRNSGFSLNVMTDDEVHEIHLATLEVLKDTGVFVESEEALEIFDGGGCRVDARNKIVKFPHWVVEDAIQSAPATFHAYGRRPEDDVVLDDNRVTFTNFGEGIMFVDPYSAEHRETTKADIEKAARVIDYLEHIETYERAMCSHDKPPQVQIGGASPPQRRSFPYKHNQTPLVRSGRRIPGTKNRRNLRNNCRR